MPGAATNTYTIQTVTLPPGTVTVKLHSAISGLTVPSSATIRFDGPMVERVDARQLGVVDPETMRFSYIEDYSTYSEGFWFKVLQKEAEIQVLLNEGSGDTHFFWGRIQPAEADIEELSLIDGAVYRMGSFDAVSMIIALKDVTIAELDTEVGSHDVTEFNGYEFISLKALLASMVTLAYGQAYSTANVSLEGLDFYFKNTTTGTEQDWDYWYVWRENLQTGADNEHLNNWYTSYPDAFELLSGLAKTFGCIARYNYDAGTLTHEIALISRITSYREVTEEMPTVPSESAFHPSTDMTTKTVYVFRRRDVGTVTNPQVYINDGNIFAGDPSPIQAGVSLAMEMDADDGYGNNDFPDAGADGELAAALYSLDTPGATDMCPFQQTYYFRWDTLSFVEVGQWTRAMVEYLYYIFRNQRREYERTYSSLIGPDNSHTSVQLLRRTLIDDGRAGYVLYDCESGQMKPGGAWGTDSVSADAAVGSYSNKMAVDGTASAGDVLLYNDTTPVDDWSAYPGIYFWIKSSVKTAYGDLIAGGKEGATVVWESPLPALEINTWQRVYLRFGVVSGQDITDVDYFYIKQNIDIGAIDLYIDDVQLTYVREFQAYEVQKDLTTARLTVRWLEI